jgi:hypothetical protein
MRLAWWFSTLNLGMGTQAAISAAMFPEGINPNQQLIAAVIFMGMATLFAVLALILDKAWPRPPE